MAQPCECALACIQENQLVHQRAIRSEAQPNEVLVSSAVKVMVSGSDITFTDRGTHFLKGLSGEWRIFTPDISDASVCECSSVSTAIQVIQHRYARIKT